jgi:hypothetical protein
MITLALTEFKVKRFIIFSRKSLYFFFFLTLPLMDLPAPPMAALPATPAAPANTVPPPPVDPCAPPPPEPAACEVWAELPPAPTPEKPS